MNDLGSTFTDKELKELEREILSVYEQASKDIKQKLDEFNREYAVKEQIHLRELAEGKITQAQFDSWKKGQVFQSKQWEAKRDQIQGVIADANSIATNILNGHMTNVFASNANFMSYQIEHTAGINFGFGIYDSATVSNLLKNNPQLLPEWKINEPKDYIWNQKIVNRSIIEGIIQGEKLDQIADRLAVGLQTRNKNKMLTFARTAMTGAQNAGRLYSLDEAKGLGIKAKKQWMCTLDFHTRTNHRLLDGQIKDNDKPFEISGYKIMYPGDPTAAPEMVYNCRCTMVGVVRDYPAEYERYDNIDGKPIKNMTYSEWEKTKKKQEKDVEGLFNMLDESQASGLISIFANKKMSNLYNEMREIDTKTATAFYNELKKMGKPSEVWNQYINGTLPNNIDTSRLNGILQSYAEKRGINIPIPDLPKPPTSTGGSTLREIFGGRKMSNVYNEIKSIDTSIANQFYKELGSMGKPSDIWNQYLEDKLSADQKSRIEDILKKYASKKGLTITPDTPQSVDIRSIVKSKRMSTIYNELKEIDTKNANKFYNELKKMGKPSDVWQQYIDGTLSDDKKKKIESYLQSYIKSIGEPIIKEPPKPREPDKEWVEKSLIGDIFKKNTKNPSTMRSEVIDQIMKTPNNYRQCFTDTLKRIKFIKDRDNAYYQDFERKIAIDLDGELKIDKSFGTLFHETGHAMDYAYMRLRLPDKRWFDDKDRTSQMPKFLAAIDKDLARISKEIDNPLSPISQYNIDKGDDASKGVQDFFSALNPLNDKGPRKGKIPKNLLSVRYRWGHSYIYYARRDDPMIDAASELFANISGGYGDENQMKYMRKYFPNSVSIFEEIIDEMAKMIIL